MPNNLSSNWSRKLARVFLEGFEASRVLTRTVNTQLLKGKFNAASGSNVDFKRPHDYRTEETAGGDISAATKNDIIAGKATGTVQNYITIPLEWDEVEEALELDQLDEILKPAAARMITQLELNLGAYMYKNCNLHYGTPGTVVDAWSDIAGAGALMDSIGVPNDMERYYVMNPFTTANLADVQRGLSSGPDSLITTAWQNSKITDKVGNLRAMTSNALSTRTGMLAADKVGALAANPDVTYVTAKDSMTQSFSVNGFTASAVIKAGDIVQITGRNRLSLATRQTFLDGSASQVLWAGVVTADVTLDGTGAGTIVVAGPAIYEATGQYNTVDSAPVSGDVITVLGASGGIFQPNLFYHKQAFGVGSVPIKKLFSTDTIMTTKDGMQMRVSRYSDGDTNKQMVRFDIHPAFATFNPFFAGQGFGV